MKLRVLSLFSGIGAFEKALTNIGIDYELIGFSEIDKYAVKSYCAIHNIDEALNLGDITKIDISKLPSDIDLITHGSPCQDYSIAGKQGGGDKGSNTRSSLMWNTVEIVKHCKPKYVIWENVKNVLSKKHKHNFDKYINDLNDLGYTSYYKVLNSKDYGVPQNRERIYCISILGEHKPYEFPEPIKLDKCIKDILEDDVDNKYYINKPFHLVDKGHQAELDIKGMDSIKRVYGVDKVAPTLTTMGGGLREPKILINYRVRKLTPKECWRLQSFSDKDIDKCINIGISDSQLYKQAGNSITVKVLEEIFRSLFGIIY